MCPFAWWSGSTLCCVLAERAGEGFVHSHIRKSKNKNPRSTLDLAKIARFGALTFVNCTRHIFGGKQKSTPIIFVQLPTPKDARRKKWGPDAKRSGKLDGGKLKICGQFLCQLRLVAVGVGGSVVPGRVGTSEKGYLLCFLECQT